MYRHPDGDVEAVKQGWSWPAFFFTWAWALCKRIWLAAIAGFGALVAIYALALLFPENGSPALIWTGQVLISALLFGLSVFFGLRGNRMREKNLPSRGFYFEETAGASSPDGAITVFWEKKGSGQEQGERSDEPNAG
jgi:hypothetical protein